VNVLSHFFLEPEFIGKGYGRILFHEVIRTAKEELHWEAFQWESDPHAAWFYQRMGAKRIGELPCPLNPKFKTPFSSIPSASTLNQKKYICKIFWCE
jgi:GNAT superfamily N-acetyltransferase